jgi:hypothetical protein
MEEAEAPVLFCIGNPLLDISITSKKELHDKYDLAYDTTILAEEKHMPLYKEIQEEEYKCEYIPGGAAQNTSRSAQVTKCIHEQNKSTSSLYSLLKVTLTSGC